MLECIFLATRWRSDGTAYPPRKLIHSLEAGDPYAYIYVGVVLIVVIGTAIYRRRGH